MIITLVGVMENIDNDMMEAAESLGANRVKAFMKVVLPLSIPGIIVGCVLVLQDHSVLIQHLQFIRWTKESCFSNLYFTTGIKFK